MSDQQTQTHTSDEPTSNDAVVKIVQEILERLWSVREKIISKSDERSRRLKAVRDKYPEVMKAIADEEAIINIETDTSGLMQLSATQEAQIASLILSNAAAHPETLSVDSSHFTAHIVEGRRTISVADALALAKTLPPPYNDMLTAKIKRGERSVKVEPRKL